MKSSIPYLLFFLSVSFNTKANASGVSDTLHVVHYSISVDSIDYTAKTIHAQTTLLIQSKQNGVTTLPLSLLQLQIQSVNHGLINLNYSYNDTTLRIALPVILNINDTQLKLFMPVNPNKMQADGVDFIFPEIMLLIWVLVSQPIHIT